MVKPIKLVKKDLESVGYRIASLEAIESRRKPTSIEAEELENLLIQRAVFLKLIIKHEEKRQLRANRLNSRITLISSISFILLAMYAIYTSFYFVQQGVSKEIQIIMGSIIFGSLVIAAWATIYMARKIMMASLSKD